MSMFPVLLPRALCFNFPYEEMKSTNQVLNFTSLRNSPDPTTIDPNDPKGKQKAIHPAESFAEYQARKKKEDEAAKSS